MTLSNVLLKLCMLYFIARLAEHMKINSDHDFAKEIKCEIRYLTSYNLQEARAFASLCLLLKVEALALLFYLAPVVPQILYRLY